MGYGIIVLSSITYALKSQKILNNHGILSNVEKLAQSVTKKGCGYGVRVSNINLNVAIEVLKAERIKIVDLVTRE